MTPPPHTGTALLAAMRNEGPYLLEWIAYHKVIGFEDIIIVTNACTDGSDVLLSALAARGHISYYDQTVPHGEAPQDGAMRLAYKHLARTGAPWLCHIDADEFLNIRAGAGHLDDLMARAGHGDVIALPWLFFGTSGHKARRLPILPNFLSCADGFDEDTTKFKSMFRWQKFGHAQDHRPVDPLSEDITVLSAAGQSLRNNMARATKRAKYMPLHKSIAPEAAVLNHYATRSEDDFLMKNLRGDGQGKSDNKYHIHSRWFRIANQNDARDTSILRHWPATEAQLAAFRADPEINALEHACLKADLDARRALTPARRAAWTQP